MRLRLLIPAAIAAVATYAALVRDEVIVEAPGPQLTASPVFAPPAPPPAPQVAAHDVPASPYFDLRPAAAAQSTTPSVYDLLAGAPMGETPPEAPERPSDETAVEEPARAFVDDIVQEAPWKPVDEEPTQADPTPSLRVVDTSDPWQLPLDEGRFALGGWAASAGHSLVSAVTFRRRLPDDVGPGRIVLEIDASENVPVGGLVVLSDPGFAPDRDGFTLLLEASEAGPFSAAGSYRVLLAE